MAVVGLVQGRFGLTQKLYHIPRHARFPNCTVQESSPASGRPHQAARRLLNPGPNPRYYRVSARWDMDMGGGSAEGTTRPRTTAHGSRAAMRCCTPGTIFSARHFSRYLWAATKVGSEYPASPRCPPQASVRKSGGSHWPGVAGFGQMKECQCGAGRPSARARSHW